jgi:hypothetical protein
VYKRQAHSHQLFDLLNIEKNNTPPRQWKDYAVGINQAAIPDGVELIEML